MKLQNGIYTGHLGFWSNLTNTWNILVPPITSPIPGDDSTFQEVAGDASFLSSAWKVKWFTDEMVPAWKKWRLEHPGDIDVPTLLRGGYKKLD